jgi:hypothetical protein
MAKPSKRIRQQQELDTKELAVLLYDIFKDGETNGSVSNANDKKLSKKEE